MVPPMASAPHPPCGAAARNESTEPGEIERLRARRRRPERHAARFLLAALLSAVLLLTLLLTAFGTWSAEPVATKPLATPAVLPGGQPLRQIVATAGGLHLQLPVSQSAVTAIGYHHAGDGSLQLDPIGRQGNAGLFARLWHKLAGTSETSLVWYQLRGDRGPGTSVLVVGAAPGTDVYSPVDGTVVGITDYVLSNRTHGARIDVRPLRRAVRRRLAHAPARRPGADRRLERREGALEGRHRSLDLTAVERQALARYTQDAGNNVSLSVRPAPLLVGSLKILFVGDVVGAPGRRAVEERLPQLKRGARRLASASSTARTPPTASGSRRSSPSAAPRRRRRRDHARQPHLAAQGDRPVPGVVRAGDPPGELLRAQRPAAASPSRQAADGTPVAVINLLGSLFLSPAVSMFELVDGLVERGARAGAGRSSSTSTPRRRARRSRSRTGSTAG